MDLDPEDAPPRPGGNGTPARDEHAGGVTIEDGLAETGEYPALPDVLSDVACREGADLDAQTSFWLAHLESEVKRLHANWDRIDAELKRREARAGELVAELERRDAELARVRGDLEQSVAKARSLEARVAEQDARIDALGEELAAVRARLAAAEERATLLAQAKDDARGEVERLRDELAARQERIASLEAELDAQRGTLGLREQNVRRIGDLRASLAALGRTHSTTEETGAARPLPLADFVSTVASDGEPPELLPGELLIAGTPGDAADAAARHPQLVAFVNGDRIAYPLRKDRITIGRSVSSDICIGSHYVSRIHACVSRQGIATIIEDVGSKNGIRVNGERVVRRILRDGDIVSVGDEVDLTFLDARP